MSSQSQSQSSIGTREYSSTREFLSWGARRAIHGQESSAESHHSCPQPHSRSQSPLCLWQLQNHLHSSQTAQNRRTIIGTARKIVGSAAKALLRAVLQPPCTCSSSPPAATPAVTAVVTGTLFGRRRGRAQFAVQQCPRSAPEAVLELATPTNSLVKEMASGVVRIALECPRAGAAKEEGNEGLLMAEPRWTMYCNGRKVGYAVRRAWSRADARVLGTVQAVSMGAGVLPVHDEDDLEGDDEGELMYMRARFQRVVGSRDSEALYMINPDGIGGPELSIFLLRI